MIQFTKDGCRYFDKNGREIREGDFIRWPGGRIQEVYRTDKEELGTDATNPLWLASGRAVACESGIYPFEESDTDEIEVTAQRPYNFTGGAAMTHTVSDHNFTIGQTVRNFGQTATAISFHPVTGDLILRSADGCKWMADPAKCTPADTACRHRDGLVAFG